MIGFIILNNEYDVKEMIEDKSIIEKVIEEKKQREIRKKEEAVLEEKMFNQMKQDISTKLHLYLNIVAGRMKDYKPYYSPLGRWLGKTNWNVNTYSDKVMGEAISLLSKNLLAIEARYIEKSKILDNLSNLLYEDATKTSKKGQFLAKCYISYDINDETILNVFKDYTHYNLSTFLYDLKQDILIFNEQDWKTQLFAGWFIKNGTPKDIVKILNNISDKNKIFNLNDVINNLKIDEKEAKKMLKCLLKENKIIEIKKDEFGVI